MRAAGAAGAGADVQPGGVLVEHQAQRRQHPQRGVGRRVVEVADQHRSPRRDHQRGLDRGQAFRDPGGQDPQRHRGAQRYPAVILGYPADGRFGDGPNGWAQLDTGLQLADIG
ncbi:Uncharacterised protein [Mycobacterium tuberculosis]|nr:Uncharacterised protein [Mycobacterium tuberculosis]